MNLTSLIPLLALAALTTACATTPSPDPQTAALSDCSAIEGELARNAEVRRTAAQQQQDAWKAVVPFAVAARYGKGKAAVDEADQHAAELQQQAALYGCVPSR